MDEKENFSASLETCNIKLKDHRMEVAMKEDEIEKKVVILSRGRKGNKKQQSLQRHNT